MFIITNHVLHLTGDCGRTMEMSCPPMNQCKIWQNTGTEQVFISPKIFVLLSPPETEVVNEGKKDIFHLLTEVYYTWRRQGPWRGIERWEEEEKEWKGKHIITAEQSMRGQMWKVIVMLISQGLMLRDRRGDATRWQHLCWGMPVHTDKRAEQRKSYWRRMIIHCFTSQFIIGVFRLHFCFTCNQTVLALK